MELVRRVKGVNYSKVVGEGRNEDGKVLLGEIGFKVLQEDGAKACRNCSINWEMEQ